MNEKNLKLQKLFNAVNHDSNNIRNICINVERLERLNAINSSRTLRKTKEYERERER